MITNALIVDHWGIVKADVGIKNGKHRGIGKAGNPDIQPRRRYHHRPGTEAIAGEGQIDRRRHRQPHPFHLPAADRRSALMSGVTTMLGGGTGPATGTNATTCTPGPGTSADAAGGRRAPVNLGSARATPAPGGAGEQIEAGAMGLKLHEDWGTTPAAIDNCLTVAERYDPGGDSHRHAERIRFVEDTLAAFKGRATIHTYHTEGAGGGHAPDIIKACRFCRTCCRRRPTDPAVTVNTVDEHLDMLMVCHHLDPVDSRGRRLRRKPHPPRDHRRRRTSCTTSGAFSMIASDSRPWVGSAR